MYLYLGEHSKYRASDVAKQVFLRALTDPAELVRLRAIEGLKTYDDAEVNQALHNAIGTRSTDSV